jgi:hypothetical protein
LSPLPSEKPADEFHVTGREPAADTFPPGFLLYMKGGMYVKCQFEKVEPGKVSPKQIILSLSELLF